MPLAGFISPRTGYAEKHLEIALRIRNADVKGPTFDAATSREKLAVVYEMRGNLVAASDSVPGALYVLFSSRTEQAIFYCSVY
jgi:ADP-ribosylglycohydrolase